MDSEPTVAHRALVELFECLYAALDDASFEQSSDLIVALHPPFPIPQCNAAWVVEDSQTAVDALPVAIAEIEAAGAWPWVQTRSGHTRTREASLELGLTEIVRLPGMVLRSGELVATSAPIEIGPIEDDEVDETNELLAGVFGAPKELFDDFCSALRTIDGASWYVGRDGDRIVSTAVGIARGGTTGIFNVATPPEERGRGYGAAITARAVGDGFAAGSRLAFLQSSELGHGVYRRLGFRDVEEYVLLTRPFPA
jgi:GNAT superfamily N-acetyltransferase